MLRLVMRGRGRVLFTFKKLVIATALQIINKRIEARLLSVLVVVVALSSSTKYGSDEFVPSLVRLDMVDSENVDPAMAEANKFLLRSALGMLL
ncbi:hypothetical protein Glove_232g167 [Diversispora epigaea]|nr:hypothetical protein Glove_232g167 [Diversispora epigaea]